MTPRDRLAHRALVAAVVHGILDAKHAAELVVATDETAFRAALPPNGAIAVVASSPTAAALVAAASREAATSTSTPWARACAWGAMRAGAAIAPALDSARLHAIVETAREAGLSLVVPDVALAAPSLAQIAQARLPRTAVARAALHLYARGALAFPLLFVPHARAPKNGLPKSKVDRIADGWVAASASVPSSVAVGPPAAAPIVAVATGVLAAGGPATSFKELLRAAREVNGAATDDTKQLAAGLYRLWSDGAVDLFAVDPQRHFPFSS